MTCYTVNKHIEEHIEEHYKVLFQGALSGALQRATKVLAQKFTKQTFNNKDIVSLQSRHQELFSTALLAIQICQTFFTDLVG